tara:strand:- start:3098 stop:3652 length:555 start_codon:yes stop_codon:yes gene_type:complete
MIKFNIGCGWRDFGKDWIHVDGGDYEHLDNNDIYLSSVEDETADLIYASHFIEYFDREEIINLLDVWRGRLKTGGTLRISVPDFESMVSLYAEYKLGYDNYPLDNFLGPLYGKMKMGDKTIYHKTTYDFESLNNLLIDVGMKNIKRYDWRETEHSEFDDHSQSYLPHMDKDNGTLISLNVECIK